MVRFLLIAVLSSTSVALRRSGKTDLIDSTGDADLAEELGEPVDLNGELAEISEDDEDESADGKETELPPASIADVEQQCGTAGSTRIVNGEDSQDCMWKWQVTLHMKENSKYVECGGSLIHPLWVLTAAHCFDYGDIPWVAAGLYNLSKSSPNEQYREVKNIHIHERYDSSTLNFDFALMELKSPFQLGTCVGTVCLPKATDRGPDANTDAWITGFGSLSYEDQSKPKILQQGKVSIISNDDCKNTGYATHEYKVLPSMLCAQGKASNGVIDACSGDSGGPLVVLKNNRWTVYGITSWGEGCAKKRYPGIYSKVVREKAWIKNTVGRDLVGL